MVCLVLTQLIEERGPEFAEKVRTAVLELLPASVTSNNDLTLERLVAMQSGLRDYWVLTVLWGATPQDRFSIYQDTPKALKRLGNFHFAPGAEMSYSNTNFAAVGLAIEKVTGETLSNLLNERLFSPAGMETAALIPDTARIPPPLVGYEGSEDTGYIAYANRIEWSGDAGIMASLDDMIAYEKYIDCSSQDSNSVYSKNSQDPKFIDGKRAYYGNGLVHNDVEGVKVVTHTGGLAGFRLRRAYVPELRLSIINLLNCEDEHARPMYEHILKLMLKAAPSKKLQNIRLGEPPSSKVEVSWTGHYIVEETRLAVVVKQDKPGQIKVDHGGHDAKLFIKDNDQNTAVSTDDAMKIVFEDGKLKIEQPHENHSAVARPLAATEGNTINAADFVGQYYSEEIDSTFHVTGSGSMLYGAFDGYLGKGPIHVMRWLGEGVWWLACFRSLDASPPGNWTVAFDRSGSGKGHDTVTVGCWLGRKVAYKKVSKSS